MNDITAQDRRDIAENLRSIAEFPGRHVRYVEQFKELLEDEIFPDVEYHDYSDMFEQLANLIDPTCEGIHRREPDDIDGTPRFTIHCSDCGQLLDETSGIPHSPMYCPNCGTRIIRGRLYSQSEDSSEVVED